MNFLYKQEIIDPEAEIEEEEAPQGRDQFLSYINIKIYKRFSI